MNTRDLDSTGRLARDISHRLRDELPTGFSPTGATPAVRNALVAAEHRNEERIGRVRVALVLAYLGVVVVTALRAGRADPPGARDAAAVALALAWTAAATALLVALRRAWCPPWLRHAVPPMDATFLATAFLAARWQAGAAWPAAEAGSLAVLTPLCAALAFSGAFRLTSEAAILSGLSALATVALVALVSRFPVPFTVGALVGLGIAAVAAREMAGMVRRILSEEIGRVELARLYDLARQTVSSREETMKIVAHDLRNPLHTVALATSFLLDVPDAPPVLRAKQLEAVRRATERMQRLIRDLLDVARMEAGTVVVEPAPVPPRALLTDALEAMGSQAGAAGIALAIADPEALERLPQVEADAERVAQVFSNLIGNAIKFTPRGGRIALGAAPSGGMVFFSVTDTGPGIPAEQLPNVFGRFWQASRRDGRGIGLGLAIAQGIVTAHGGKIGVDSEVGVGTKFWFGLPQAAPNDAFETTSGARGRVLSVGGPSADPRPA